MDSGSRAIVLAAYDSRSRVVRDGEGTIHFSWGVLSIKMTQNEFVSFVGLVKGAVGCVARCGELSRGSCGRVVRCSMGQIMVSHGSITLWLSPEEFEEFYQLVARARQRLSDAEPLPTLGLPWAPPDQELLSLN